MAFVTDKEELKPGLVIFRRGDLQTRDWYCRVRLPKATRYKTIALKTPDITTARTLAYDHESEVRFALKRNLPVFNRPFSAVAKDYVAEQRLRAQRGEITIGRVKLIESVVKNQLNPYVGKTQIDLIALDRWQNYPSWRRSLGQGRMTRHGNVRPMTEVERSAAREVAEGKAAEKRRRSGKESDANIKAEQTDWIIVSDATIRFEMKIYRAIINDAVSKQEAPPHHRIEGMPSLEKQRRDPYREELGALPLAHFGEPSAQLLSQCSLQPGPREVSRSVCSPSLADGQGFSTNPNPRGGYEEGLFNHTDTLERHRDRNQVERRLSGL